MLSMTNIAHVAVYDTLADWEIGYLLVELRTGTVHRSAVRDRDRWVLDRADHHHGWIADPARPDARRSRTRIEQSADPGWRGHVGRRPWSALHRCRPALLDAKTPVAAICGATASPEPGCSTTAITPAPRPSTSPQPDTRRRALPRGAGRDRRRPDHRGPQSSVQSARGASALGLASRRRWPRTRRSCTAATERLSGDDGGVTVPARSAWPEPPRPRRRDAHPDHPDHPAECPAARGRPTRQRPPWPPPWWQVLGGVLDQPRRCPRSAGGWGSGRACPSGRSWSATA